MKNIVLLLLLCIGFMANAQEASDYDAKIDYGGTWWTWPANGTSVSATPYATTATDSIWYYTVLKESQDSLLYEYKIRTDSISGTVSTVNFYLQTKLWYSDTYTDIDTVSWSTGVDTTFSFTTSTPLKKRYFRTYVKSESSGFVFKILEHSSIFWRP